MKTCDFDEQLLSFSYSHRFAQNDTKTFHDHSKAEPPDLYDYAKMTYIHPVITDNDMAKMDYLLLIHPVEDYILCQRIKKSVIVNT